MRWGKGASGTAVFPKGLGFRGLGSRKWEVGRCVCGGGVLLISPGSINHGLTMLMVDFRLTLYTSSLTLPSPVYVQKFLIPLYPKVALKRVRNLILIIKIFTFSSHRFPPCPQGKSESMATWVNPMQCVPTSLLNSSRSWRRSFTSTST